MPRPRGREPERIERYDVVVVGSGFGGSVAALRATEKGYRVAVLEAGARFDEEALPATSWQLDRFLFAPKLGWYGIQRIDLLRDVLVLSGAGVGGGSLVYAGTLYEPGDAFYRDPQWRDITDWRVELAPFFDLARRMLGRAVNPTTTAADRVMKQVADEMGVGDTYQRTKVGVLFGEPGDEPGAAVGDPYFGGAGPNRNTCIECGGCMTGCRFNAKNTLPKNYLYLAERGGATVFEKTTAVAVRPLARGGYAVDTAPTGATARAGSDPRIGRGGRTFLAERVVLAAGALGTQRLLHRMRDTGRLPGLSPTLGRLTRTNSESIVGSMGWGREVDYSKGVAISSSFAPDSNTHVEPVRYAAGSNAMGLLQTVLTDGGGRLPRWTAWAGTVAAHPLTWLRSLDLRHWSERTIIALVMQDLDNSLTLRWRRGWRGGRLTSEPGHGEPNPTWIPVANRVVRRMAELMDGVPGGSVTEIFDIPITAHIIGGAVIGSGPEHGVIDPYHRVYGHDGLYVLDGAAVSANLGVNPSLTIVAQAERAMACWPNVGEPDRRPPTGAGYNRLAPIAPVKPAVPASAPAGLRW